MQDVYFAAKEAEAAASILLDRAQSFYNFLNANAYLEKLQRMWRAYHGAYNDYMGFSHRVNFAGEQGELVQMPVNHFRNLAQHIYVMITANRPMMEAKAINTDYKSLAQTVVANGVLDYYMRERRLEDALKKACELSIVLGAGFVKMEWNATAGDVYDNDPDTNEPVYHGDIEFSNLTPFDVIIDGTKESWSHDWIMCRTFKNRYDLMAKYPELADKIRKIPAKVDSTVYRLAVFTNDQTDDIPVYEFYHKRTESMPDGRYMLFLDRDIVLLDTPMPYRVIPIFRIAPGDILGTPYGYSPMFDIFPIQEVINSTMSAIVTNHNTFAVQNVYVPRGADISISSIEGGMNIVEGNAKPEPLNLTETPTEVFKFIEMLVQTAETISGVNSVARGNPEASLKSGTALALVQSMALQFISGLQQSYVRLVEDVGTALVQILKDFAHTPRVISLVGKNNRPLLKEFTSDSISAINRVIVDVGNPLAKTIAGRVQMAEQMMQMGAIKQPEQYFQVINTGRLDATFEGEMNELLLIKAENEKMLDGNMPLVSPLDKHRLHIAEHRAVLADPDLRNNPDFVRVVLDHIQEHLDMLRNTDPDLLALIGEQALPPAGMTMPGGGQMPPPEQQPRPSAEDGSNSPLMQQQGLPQSGEMMQGGAAAGASLPNIPSPPPPFENLPSGPTTQ